jgi:peptide/nickel transport system substrate-binding protein
MKLFSNKTQSALIGLSVLALIVSAGCRSNHNGPSSVRNSVVWYIQADVESLNPVLSQDEGATYVEGEMFEALTGNNPRTQGYIPLLAKMPVESADHLTYTFEMDPAAHWSDGKPVTVKDVLFSYKLINNPLVINAAPLRSYYAALDSCWIPAENPNSIVFHFSKYRYDLLKILNYSRILPAHIWDPQDLTSKVSWKDLRDPKSTNPAIKSIADEFQNTSYQRDAGHLIGSGPYKFSQWVTNDRVILQKDSNYWGRDRAWLDAYPEQIIFKTIKDENSALISLKRGDIDIDPSMTANQYLVDLDLAKYPNIKKDTVYENLYSFLGWNNANPIFSDKRVRKALTMLVNRDQIIQYILKGLSKKVEGPVAPTQPNYDATVKQPEFNPTAAKQLLAEAGWTDSDGDGVLDKKINGKVTPFRFTFQVSSGSEIAKNILVTVANDLKKAGIVADVTQLERLVFLNNLRSHSFDCYFGGWVGNQTGSEGLEDEIGQLWESSESKKGGSNYYSYSNPEADKLMEAIKVEPDRNKRIEMSRRLQQIIVEDQPVTFMYSSPNRIGWIDRFDNFEFFPTRPPFDPRFWMVRGSGVKRTANGVPMSLPTATKTAQ